VKINKRKINGETAPHWVLSFRSICANSYMSQKGIISLLRRRPHWQWRAAKLGHCLVLDDFWTGGIFPVTHLLCLRFCSWLLGCRDHRPAVFVFKWTHHALVSVTEGGGSRDGDLFLQGIGVEKGGNADLNSTIFVTVISSKWCRVWLKQTHSVQYNVTKWGLNTFNITDKLQNVEAK
jgi:hypothetical protein